MTEDLNTTPANINEFYPTLATNRLLDQFADLIARHSAAQFWKTELANPLPKSCGPNNKSRSHYSVPASVRPGDGTNNTNKSNKEVANAAGDREVEVEAA